MARNTNREEKLRIAAEKVRIQKEKEEREDKEFYERITSGRPWLMFKAVVVFCTLMAVITTIEVLVDGPTKKLSESSWGINQNWHYNGHIVLNVEGYMFAPTYESWGSHLDNTLQLIYSPIFQTGKKLRFDSQPHGDEKIIRYEVTRERSIFTWFPLLQIFLLIPLFTFIFRRQSPWFNFARVASFIIVLPGTLLVILFALM